MEDIRIEVTQPRKNQRQVSVVHAHGRIDVVRVTEKAAMEALHARVKLLASLRVTALRDTLSRIDSIQKPE